MIQLTVSLDFIPKSAVHHSPFLPQQVPIICLFSIVHELMGESLDFGNQRAVF